MGGSWHSHVVKPGKMWMWPQLWDLVVIALLNAPNQVACKAASWACRLADTELGDLGEVLEGPIPSEKGRRVPELCNRWLEILACFLHVSHVSLTCFLRFARVLLPFVGWKHMGFLLRPNVVRPSSPSIVRISDFCPKKKVKWHDLSVRRRFRLKMETRWRDLPAKLFTRGFSFKKETLWRNLPANFYECGTSSKKEGGGKNHYFNRNSCYISMEQ